MVGNAHPTTSPLIPDYSPQSKIQNPKSKILKMLDPVDIKRDIQTLTDRLGKTQDYL
jgi:putative IMPACT (imprinted ancient) family translation regulator